MAETPGSRGLYGFDARVAHPARVYDYWLGGKDNFEADRIAGEETIAAYPAIRASARANRAFLARTVSYLAADAGIRQFLDLGTGLPTANNTHEVAQAVAPESRIVYVDYDPLVLVHARALLTSGPEGATDYIDADLRDSDTILREAARTLDLDQPVALFLMGILGHIEDDAEAKSIIDKIMGRLAPGSYLAMYDGSDTSEANNEAVRIWNISANPKYHLRSAARIAGLFEGLELVEPGVVPVTRWKPEPGAENAPEIDQYCAVGRKP